MKTNNLYSEAQSLYDKRDFDNSFKAFKQLAENESFTKEERADAYNMMGIIISFVSYSDYTNMTIGEIELLFFKKAVLLDPYCIGALLNIISSFGTESLGMHRDKEVFIQAYEVLNTKLYQYLSEFHKNEMQRKYAIYQNIDK